MCVREPFDFMVPFVSTNIAMLGAAASFKWEAGPCVFMFCFSALYATQFLLGEIPQLKACFST